MLCYQTHPALASQPLYRSLLTPPSPPPLPCPAQADYITDGMDSDPGGSQAHDLDPDLADERTVRLHNRMVKNRESAARSRLRRQQYTSELEQRVMELDEHNQQLARRLQELLGSHKQQQHKQQEQPQPEPRQPQQPAMGSCGGCGLCGGAARPALRRVKSF